MTSRKGHFQAKAELKGIDNLSIPWAKALRQAEQNAGRSFGRIEKAGMRARRAMLRTAGAGAAIGRESRRSFGPAIAGLKGVGIAAAGAAAGGALAVDRFGDYELEVARIGNLLPSTVDAVELLDGVLKKQAATLGIAPMDVALAGYQALSSGVDASVESLDAFLEVAGKATVASGGEMATSVSALTAIMNTYKDSGLTALEVSDKLFKAEALGVTNFDQIAQNIGQVVSQAKELGVDLDQLLASMAALTKTGLGTSDAFTQISAILSGIQTGGTGGTASVFQELGLPTGAEAIAQVGGLDAYVARLREVIQSGKEIKGQRGKDLLPLLFGRKEAQKGLFALTGSQFEGHRATLAGIRESMGQTEANFANLEKRTGFRVRQMQVAFGQMATALGGGIAEGLGLGDLESIPDAALGASRKIQSAASGFFKAFSKAFEPMALASDLDWDAWAADAGAALGKIATAAVRVGKAIAFVLEKYAELLNLAGGTGKEIDENRSKAERAAEEQGAAILQVGEDFRTGGADWNRARGTRELFERGLMRKVSPRELADIRLRREAEMRRRGGAFRVDDPAFFPVDTGGQGPLRVGGEVTIKVETDEGSTATVTATDSASTDVPIKVDTGTRSSGGL